MFDYVDSTTRDFIQKFYIKDEDTDDIFSNPVPITVEDEKPSSIVSCSRDQVKRDSLMRSLRDVVVNPDLGEYRVDNYNRQQVVLDELSFDPQIDELVDDIVFPEVGAERLTEKKLSALTIVTNKGIIAARNNEHILTHCVECRLGDEEAVVFGIKLRDSDYRYYRWHRDIIVSTVSTGVCWLRYSDSVFYNMTIGVECAESEKPDYCIPSFNEVDSYYVWIDGMIYLLPSQHVFSLRADGRNLVDKNGVVYAPTTVVGLVLSTIDGHILCPSRRPPDSTQVIVSISKAGVITKDVITRFPILRNEGFYVINSDLKSYVRDYPDTTIHGFQLIGMSHSMMQHRCRMLYDNKPRHVIIGHNMFPQFNGDNHYVKISGKLYTRKRTRGRKKIVISNNKYGVPAGTWYEV